LDAQQEGGEDLMMAMELEMEARNPSSAAFRQQPQTAVGRRLAWVLSFAVPGLGMFTEGATACAVAFEAIAEDGRRCPALHIVQYWQSCPDVVLLGLQRTLSSPWAT
jgi:hypothetical protein